MNLRALAIISQTLILILIVGVVTFLGKSGALDKTSIGSLLGAVLGYVGGKMHDVSGMVRERYDSAGTIRERQDA